MNDVVNNVRLVSIEEELKKSYLDYAMSVIIGRALPDVRDGLKPVHRRVLYAMHVLGNYWNKPYKKSARIVGDVIGKYHPHGDSAVYDTIVRLAQSFSMRYMLIDGQGNFGSIDGDSAAAMRYTEIRMSKIAYELLEDLDKKTVKFVSNYDGTEEIPDVMPTRIPNLLINGSSGIAVGMATNIPPHNLNEVINGCLAYLNDSNITIHNLLKYIPGPDFPTSAIIIGKKGIIDAYHTGKGIIHIRARVNIEKNQKTQREKIIIYELPYQVNKSKLIEKIAELVREKRIDGIYALRDESDKDGLRIVIEIKRDAIAEIILNNLYALTQLQINFGINMVALCNGKPRLLNLKDIIKHFIYHRKHIITRRIIFELEKARERAHILEAFAIALVNLSSMIKMIRSVLTPNEAKLNLINYAWDLGNIKDILVKHSSTNIFKPKWVKDQYGVHESQYFFTKKQAQAILNLRLHKLTNLEHKKILYEYDMILKKIKNLLSILESPMQLIDIVRKELIDIRKKYFDLRRTEIREHVPDINTEDLIYQEEVVVTLSHKGYIKYQPLSDYTAQKRGGKGKSAVRIKEEDFIERLLVTNTHANILCFSNFGRLYCIKVYQLPQSTRVARGKPIINILPLNKRERITAIFSLDKFNNTYYILMVTSKGIIKKTALNDFKKPRKIGIIAITLHKDDELVGVDLTNGKNQIMLFSAYGKVVRFTEDKVRPMGRLAIGIKGIKLKENDRVVSLIIPDNHQDILTVTENGYGKRTDQTEYPIKSRATQGVIGMKINKRNGKLISAIQVTKIDQIMLITNSGTLVRIRVEEINMIGRNTQGVILIRTAPEEKVVALQRVVNSEKILRKI
ncbi:MAG: DNA topoisomerase (ATP-hydrolyzing) subunit A [Arsenophonus sp.]|nr:MAG: DNA topoisomerase (ATP-hydrolyzing) subunit A [Arsenophonus sp.]